MATQRYVEINDLQVKMKVLGNLINQLNSLTLENGTASLVQLRRPIVYTNDLLIAYSEFISKASKLFDKSSYDDTDNTFSSIRTTINALTSKATSISDMLRRIKDAIIQVSNNNTGTDIQSQYEQNLFNLRNQYGKDVNNSKYEQYNFNNINKDASGNYPTSGIIDGSGNLNIEYRVSPDQTSEVLGYADIVTVCTVNNAGLDLDSDPSGNTGYPTWDELTALADVSGVEAFNLNNSEKIANFQRYITSAIEVLDANQIICNSDRDKNAALYQAFKNELVEAAQNEYNQADLKRNLLAFSQDNKFIYPFLGTVNGARN